MSIKDVYNAALGLLARREHSQYELEQKLFKRDFDREYINEAMAKLIKRDLQSDARYAKSCFISRVKKGYGPNYIKQYLSQRRISELLIDQTFVESEVNWLECIERVWQKKYNCVPKDLKTKAKQQNFLYYRGFESDTINKLFKDK